MPGAQGGWHKIRTDIHGVVGWKSGCRRLRDEWPAE